MCGKEYIYSTSTECESWITHAACSSKYIRSISRIRKLKHVYFNSWSFTRWMEAYPIPNPEAYTVAKKNYGIFFLRFSPLEQLHSDQGCLFESQLFSEVCKLLGITKIHTTANHTQSDSLIERYIIELYSPFLPQQQMGIDIIGRTIATTFHGLQY